MKKNILFVDDDKNILAGLRRMLRPLRNEWSVQFASSGDEALRILGEAEFDVIVSDMRMPGMDGAELLHRVKREYPAMVRLLLSGFSEVGQAMRAVGVAHQFLSKPCSSDVLRSIIQRALALRTHLQQESLRAAIGCINGLPPLPTTFARLRESLASEDVDLKQIASIVEEDTSLTSKLLQLVNSSLFGLARPVGTMQEATTFLGTTLLRDLTLSAETFRMFEEFSYPEGFSLQREMGHAKLTALIARELAGGRGVGDEAFLAAMLHDIGWLVMATKLQDAYAEVAAAVAAPGELRFEVERRLLGATHAEIGAYLLGIWGLPDSIVEAVAFHHEPAALPHSEVSLIEIVHVANALARELRTTTSLPGEPHFHATIDLAHLEALGALDQLEAWRKTAQAVYDSETAQV